jgi:hypothetical protein
MPMSVGQFFEATLVFCGLLDRLYRYITNGSHPPQKKHQPSKKFVFFEIFRIDGYLEIKKWHILMPTQPSIHKFLRQFISNLHQV